MLEELRGAQRQSPRTHDASVSQGSPQGSFFEDSVATGFDRGLNAAIARLTMGISPAAAAMQYFDWLAHLAISPGKQLQLSEKAMRKGTRLASYAAVSAFDADAPFAIQPLPQDHRFDHPGWRRFPFNLVAQSFLFHQQWWHNATTDIRGMSERNEGAVCFAARQFLDMMAPSNFPWLNPEIIEATFREGGANLWRGLAYFFEDARRARNGEPPAGAEAFQVGKNVAVTSGKVIYRNDLMELIQYAPATEDVYAEPVLMQSAWMMKYYIMDLSPHNSLVKYLVDRGHTVFMISWRNPGAEDGDLSMDDYRTRGTLAAIDVISRILPGRKVHAVGYCLGGILLVITAAAMARDGDERLGSITLFTTLTDFTDVGEMGIFMHPSQITFLEDLMWQQGYLDHRQASGSFQMLKSRDLVWSKMVREYFLGERAPMFDLMAWNADGTRMPARQHAELLRQLYLENRLFRGQYMVEDRPVQISDIHAPIFCVAAERDHVAPWRSVFKLHLQSDAPALTFVLTKGGHNVGIVNEPGHPRRAFRLRTIAEGERAPDAETWVDQTPPRDGSWWPAWADWLKEHSSGCLTPPPMGAQDKGYPPLEDAPGTYVHQT